MDVHGYNVVFKNTKKFMSVFCMFVTLTRKVPLVCGGTKIHEDHMQGWQRRYVCEPYLNSLGLHICLCEAHHTNWQGFFLILSCRTTADLTS
jgi:hypothetical protein